MNTMILEAAISSVVIFMLIFLFHKTVLCMFENRHKNLVEPIMTTTNNINKRQLVTLVTDKINSPIGDIPMGVRIYCQDISDLPKDPMLGTTAIVLTKEGDCEIYAYLDDQWHNLGPVSEEEEDEFTVVGTNCPNCGAVVNKHNEECEYCGTPYARMRVIQ